MNVPNDPSRAQTMTLRMLAVVAMLCATAWGAAPPAPWTKAQLAILAQRDQLGQSLQRLYDAKQHDNLLAAQRRIHEIERELFGETDAQTLATLYQLSTFQIEFGNYDEAIKLRKDLLRLQQKRFGKGHWKLAEAECNLQIATRTAAMTKAERDRLAWASQLKGHIEALVQSKKAKDALPLATELRSLMSKLFGEQHHHYGDALEELAAVHTAIGDTDKAVSLYQEAAKINRLALTDSHPRYAYTLLRLAVLLLEKGESEKAIPLFEEALKIRRAALGERHADIATPLSFLAMIYHKAGDYAQALPLYQEALALRREAFGAEDSRTLLSHTSLAKLHLAMGSYAEALPLFQEAIRVHTKSGKYQNLEYAGYLDAIAIIYHSRSESAKALPIVQEALELRRKLQGEAHPEFVGSLSNLAIIYQGMGEKAKALVRFETAIDIARKRGTEKYPEYATILNNLGMLHVELKEYDTAQKLLEEVTEHFRIANGENHPVYARSLDNLALLYGYKGQADKALPLVVKAREIYRKTVGPQHPDYAISTEILADLHAAMGKHPEALKLYETVRDIRRTALGETHPHFHAVGFRISQTYSRLGKHKEAAQLARESLLGVEKQLDAEFDHRGERQRNQLILETLPRLSFLLSAQQQSDVSAAQQYAVVCGWKERVARTSLDRAILEEPGLGLDVQKLQLISSQLARLVLDSPPPAQQQAWVKQLRALTEQKESLEAELSRRSAVFRSRKERQSVTQSQLVKFLPEDVAFIDLIEYTHHTLPRGGKGDLHLEQRLLAFVLRPGKEVVSVQLGAALPVAEAVNRWRDELEKRPMEGRKVRTEAASVLRERVWNKVAKHIGGAKTVVVSPDGALCQFPFAALPGSKVGTYLIEEVAISQVGSLTQLYEFVRPESTDTRRGKGLLAVGGIDYGEGRAYFPLPGTGPEARRCRELFQRAFPDEPSWLLEGKDATTGAVRTRMTQRPRHLHLATHGYALKGEAYSQDGRMVFAIKSGQHTPLLQLQPVRSPEALKQWGERVLALSQLPGLRCGLALSGANQPPNKEAAWPNELTGQDLEMIDLRGCELAVLSACQTGLSDRTQGVLGLQRAFHAAGVRTTVTSLWSVQDAATAELMEEFYKNLWGGKKMSRLEALRQAQLTILRNPERVRKRSERLLAEALKRGLPEAEFRGIKGRLAVDLPDGGKIEEAKKSKSSPETWWAAFVLSGDWR